MRSIITMCPIIMISLFISCEQQDEVAPVHETASLTNSIIASDQFKNLGVPLTSLNVSNSQFTTSKKKSLVIPFDGQEDKKGVLALFNDQYELLYIAIIETQTSIPTDQIPSEIDNGKFHGDFTFTTETGSLQLSLENSTITGSRTTRSATARKEPRCNDITRRGGAYDCAGARIQKRNWFDKSICYINFGYCFAEEVISCAIDGCTVD
jgi:hypothetical protein